MSNSPQSQAPMPSADSSSSLASLSEHQLPAKKRTALNPVYSAMLRSNTMRDCYQVQDMMTQCMQHQRDNDSFVCQTAEQYYWKCAKSQAWTHEEGSFPVHNMMKRMWNNQPSEASDRRLSCYHAANTDWTGFLPVISDFSEVFFVDCW
jgi:hypothetical protein